MLFQKIDTFIIRLLSDNKYIMWLIIGLVLIIVIVIILVVLLCGKKKSSDIKMDQIVPNLNLSRYSGLWYEIARLPNPFEIGCTNSLAIYSESKISNGFKITNECFRNGVKIVIEGQAIARFKPIQKGVYPGSFDVKFDNIPFKGDYNVYYIDENYQYALVGSNDKKYMWILSRRPHMDPSILHFLIEHAKNIGFKTDNIQIDNTER